MRRVFGWALLAAWVAFAASVLLFLVFELFPSLPADTALAREVRYYQLASRYRPDPRLAFVPAPGRSGGRYSTKGDLYSERYGVPADPIEMETSYNEHGFRTNSSSPPYDVLLLGDSYLEIGERDDLTLSEQLKKESGLSTFNLGRAWYGPDQYLLLFEQFAPVVRPRITLLCFFGGNDIDDIRMFAAWQQGGTYYDFPRQDERIVARYMRAMSDTATFLRARLTARFPVLERARRWLDAAVAGAVAFASEHVHPDLALVRLGSRLVAMRMHYLDQPRTPKQLLAHDEWKHLGALLERFDAQAKSQGIVPIVVYIPTHAQTYAGLVSAESGTDVLRELKRLRGHQSSQRDALAHLTAKRGMEFIDLLGPFRRLASEGVDLYYPFDTHWTPEGRRAAASVIAESLKHTP